MICCPLDYLNNYVYVNASNKSSKKNTMTRKLFKRIKCFLLSTELWKNYIKNDTNLFKFKSNIIISVIIDNTFFDFTRYL